MTAGQLREFLGSLQGEYRDRPPLISSDPLWIEEIATRARRAAETLDALGLGIHSPSLLEPQAISKVLDDLRHFLGHYELFGLPVGTRQDREQLVAFAEHAAYSSRHHGLFLIPDLPDPEATLEFFDPLPSVRSIATRPDLWPGMLFWMAAGASTFAPLAAAYGLYQRLLEAFPEGETTIRKILEDFDATLRASDSKRLFHLSDLHFGTRKALENQAYLSTHLASKVDQRDRVVITGDLFDNPKRADALAFRNFRMDLEARTGRSAIVIPGNHDQKLFGNTILGFGRKLRQVADLEWSSLVVDDDLRYVFYCFDSSKDARDFARGRVSREQMMEVATMFEAKAVVRPDIRHYLSVALLHHHPYSFNAKTETRVQRVLKAFGLVDERFLRMDNAEEFLSWCVGRQVPLVLHGHKHVARYVSDQIKWAHGKRDVWRHVTAVGCGTSLGIEDLPLSYNILEWLPSSRRWVASFYADPGLGTGFEEQYVTLHTVEHGFEEAA